MNKKFVKSISALFVLCVFAAVSTDAQDESELLSRQYSEQRRKKCGERGEAIGNGRRLIELYKSDPQKKEIVEELKKQVAKIEKEDPACRRYDRYNKSFQTKNWQEFFTVAKEIIAEEGNSPVVLDVMLDLVSVGYDRAAVDKIDTFNDTLLYAKLAIQQIEAGQQSATGKYGAFLPFNTKDEALSWMNYITGWIMYYKMNQKKDALDYYYKATQVGNDKKYDTTIYTSIGNYYFDEAARLDAEYREKLRANNYQETDETRALLALAKGTADRAMYFFARAYKIARDSVQLRASMPKLKDSIYKTLTDLYLFRFNLVEVDPVKFDLFIEKLNEQPLPDSLTPIQPE